MNPEKIILVLTLFTLAYFVFLLVRYGSTRVFLLNILYLLPFMNFLATKVSMGGFKVFDVVTFCSLLYLLRFFLIKNVIRDKSAYLFFFIGLMAVVLIGSFISEHPGSSLLDALKILPIFIFGRFLLLECLQDDGFHDQVVKALKIVFTVALAFLAVQVVVGLKFTFYSSLNINTFDPIRGLVRYPGYFNDSQVQGQYFAAGSFLFLYNPTNRTTGQKVRSYIMFLLCLAAVYISGSRSAFLGFAIGCFISLILIGRKYILYLLVLSVVAIPVSLNYLKKTGVVSRSMDASDDLKFRQSIWRDAFKISQQHPLVGIGSGNYQAYTMRHNPNQYFELENHEIMYFDQPENGYLKLLVEYGYLGLAFVLLIILLPLYSAIKSFLLKQNDWKIILLVSGVFTWIAAFNTVYSLFDTRILILVATLLVLLLTYPKKSIENIAN